MKKNCSILLCMLLAVSAKAQDIFINKDTVIYKLWSVEPGTILHFGSKGHISGKGTVRGGIIDAAIGQWIFDTTITVYPEGTYGKDFSARWYGAGRQADNAGALQKGINTVLDNPQTLRNFFIPKGIYPFGRPLMVQSVYKGSYVGTTIHIYGEASFWDCCNGTTLQYTAVSGFALGLQLNKGTEINNLIITGKFKSPVGNDSLYFNIPFEKYMDANNKCSDTYAGFVIDYDGSKNSGGSTGLSIHDINVSNFSIDYLISPNGKTFNADILVFQNIRCGDARIGFATGQAQEKGNTIRGIYSWGSIHTLFSIGRYGKSQAGQYTIDGGNVAGRCIRLFDITQIGWYATHISNLFAESIASIGSITSQIPTTVDNCTFHFALPQVVGRQNLFYANNSKVAFNNCTFRYYGLKDAMKFTGEATYNNCFFSGPSVKN